VTKPTWQGNDKLARLTALAKAGNSARKIGLELGLSRNAIIGKCASEGIQLTGGSAQDWRK
jgi:hypothetical protein